MDFNWLQNILGESSNKIVLWAKDDKKRFTLFIIISLFASIVVIPKIVQFLTTYDFIAFLSSSWSLIYTNSDTKSFISGLFMALVLLIIVILGSIYKNSKRVFKINIAKHTNIWSYYKGSGWSINEDVKSWNKVLKLTNCTYPAILKYGNEWLNYRYSFEAKIPSSVPLPHQNFTFVVRAKDKGNNVFFQCKPDGTIRPHLITNGLFIVDNINEIKFLAEFPVDKWVPVKVEVKGNEVTVGMLGVSATYAIPSTRLVLPNDLVRPVMNLDEALKLTEQSDTENISANQTQSPKVAFDLDYEKGTVGFRESGAEVALFRNIKVELLQPYYSGVF